MILALHTLEALGPLTGRLGQHASHTTSPSGSGSGSGSAWTTQLMFAAVGALLSLIFAVFGADTLERWKIRVGAKIGRYATRTPSLTGLWRSRYEFPRTGVNGLLTSEHNVVVRHSGKLVRVVSLPKPEGSVLELRLIDDGDGILSGTWRERTADQSIYHGVTQLRVSQARRKMEGRWVGYTRHGSVKGGPWSFELIERTTTRKVRRRYANDATLL